MENIDFLNDYNGKFTELSKLIQSWKLITVNSRTEFDKLTTKILGKLYEGEPENSIRQIIESELCVTYGLFNSEFNSDQLAKEVIAWWYE